MAEPAGDHCRALCDRGQSFNQGSKDKQYQIVAYSGVSYVLAAILVAGLPAASDVRGVPSLRRPPAERSIGRQFAQSRFTAR
ncbi:MAG TPA: hypothetical protein VNK52_13175 [Hyphomicrobiaceae bacterium]|nr:hypothetical protein [Hyphomicrobiaceae bacterium]